MRRLTSRSRVRSSNHNREANPAPLVFDGLVLIPIILVMPKLLHQLVVHAMNQNGRHQQTRHQRVVIPATGFQEQRKCARAISQPQERVAGNARRHFFDGLRQAAFGMAAAVGQLTRTISKSCHGIHLACKDRLWFLQNGSHGHIVPCGAFHRPMIQQCPPDTLK